MDTKQPEQVLLDQNAIIKAAGSSFLAIGGTSVHSSHSCMINGSWGNLDGWNDTDFCELCTVCRITPTCPLILASPCVCA